MSELTIKIRNIREGLGSSKFSVVHPTKGEIFFSGYQIECNAFIVGYNMSKKEQEQSPLNVRGFLARIYADWKNNYLTPAVFAEHQEITEDEGKALIELARSVFYSKNPNQ
jgi:hypothetical protein